MVRMVLMAQQHRGREEPLEQRGWLGQRARLELPVPKARMGLLERRAQQVASRQWGCW